MPQTAAEEASAADRKSLMIIGAFPPPGTRIFGGVITSCRLLLQSSLPQRAMLTLVDSTQVSNPPPRLYRRAWLAFARCLKFVAAFERVRPDAVLLFCSAGASIVEKGAMAWYARLRGRPALLFPRGGRVLGAGGIGRVWLRGMCGGAAMILCQGPAWQRFATAALGFHPARCPLVPNWSATPDLLQLGRERTERARARVELLFVGWVEPEKGIRELLEAFRRIARDRDVGLHIVGDGGGMAFARDFVANSKLQSRVRFSGWLAAEDLPAAYREADVLVLPSWAEGLPNAMIEAMAAGLAVAVTRVGNVPDVVRDRVEALLVEPRDVDGLASALAVLVDDSALRTGLGKNGHALAAREFAVEAAVDRILRVVKQVCCEYAASVPHCGGER